SQFLYRLGKLAGARLPLLEQPHVLDRDHRLIGEGGSKLDLLVGEGLDSSALENDHTDRRSFPYQRNAENGADTGETCPLQESEFGIGLNIRDMNDAAIDKARPAALPRSIPTGPSFINVTISDEIPKKLTACEMLPCGLLIPPMSASQRRTADSISASSTVFRSKVERLMTLSTSAVAVCCCRDSRSSLSRRVFSIAMT